MDAADSVRAYYLSGPMTGYPEWNYPYFNERAAEWRKRRPNWRIINPAENFGGDPDIPKALCMRTDISALLVVDGIIMLDGHESSDGATLELKIIKALELEVIYDEDYRRQWEEGGVRDGVGAGHAGGEG